MALAVAASALMSGQVMADVSWQQPGNLDQTVNFGGTITKPEYQNQWVWGVGAGFDSFQSSFTDLSEDKTELTFAAKENMPVLVGKVTEAFPLDFQAGYGAAPQIQFSGFDGNKIEMVSNDRSSVSLQIPVKGKDSLQSGVFTLTGTAQTLVMYHAKGNDMAFFGSVYSKQPGQIFYGGAPENAVSYSGLVSFGGLGSDDLLALVTKKYPDVTKKGGNTPMEGTIDRISGGAASYAFGIKAGVSQKVKFNEAVTENTEWVAPLHITVSYS
ncbi:hypothetical protein EU711_22555 [Salmonella enterica]|nr:hypothetical protein [Salmonella enterica]EEP3207887.1 hypothetical protein [Salmonella enterica subsp. enterica serovar Infantis]QVP48017.1 hypothetical protein AIT67_023190 [Salmonella enterica subsp. salamae]EDE9602399.1 hypothetical protein [Salmonella enterica]EFQ4338957.1 hypothetical protein [Salmonella enterica subsp. enterica serovar Infantis]